MTDIIGYAPNILYIMIPIFLNIILNIIFIVLDILQFFRKGNNKMTSLDKILFPLSLSELMISIFWCLSGFILDNKEKIKENEDECQVIGNFHIFFYFFEFLLIYFIITHLKHLVLNPLNYILKSKRKIIKYLLISAIASLILALICFFSDLIGESPMITCLLNYDLLFEDKKVRKICIIIILILPIILIIRALYKTIIVVRSNSYKNDNENKILFKSHIFYLLAYLLMNIFFGILYLIRGINGQNNNMEYFTFSITLILVIGPLIIGIFRFYKNKIQANRPRNMLSLSIENSRGESIHSLMEIEEEISQAEAFEISAIKKYVMNIYISICYCLEKNMQKPKLAYQELNEDMISTQYNYTITKESISKDLSKGQLVKDIMVNSREKFSISCIEYAPKIFTYLRNLDKICDYMIVTSMLPMNNNIAIKDTEGKGGSFFINSYDHEFIIKTITEKEFHVMMKILENNIVKYFRDNNNSIICRIYGVYKIYVKTGMIKKDELYFILMKNVIGSFTDNLLCKYDLKGSSFNRKVGYENIDKNVMKDLNFNEIEDSILLNKENSSKLLSIIQKDINFLSSLNIMDYSLLVVKISLNHFEMNSLFGKNHRKKTEAQYLEIIGKEIESINKLNESIEKANTEKNLIEISNENIRFKEGNIASLKKYLFPSLTPDIAYLMSIIDYFQVYNIQKDLENKYKKIRSGVKREAISSIPPDEYKKRFYDFIKQKTDSEHFLKRIYDPENKNDF